MQDLDEGTNFIWQNNAGKYHTISATDREVIGTIYMTKDTAGKICEALNSGELTL
jgi:hypothetical protein